MLYENELYKFKCATDKITVGNLTKRVVSIFSNQVPVLFEYFENCPFSDTDCVEILLPPEVSRYFLGMPLYEFFVHGNNLYASVSDMAVLGISTAPIKLVEFRRIMLAHMRYDGIEENEDKIDIEKCYSFIDEAVSFMHAGHVTDECGCLGISVTGLGYKRCVTCGAFMCRKCQETGMPSCKACNEQQLDNCP